MKTTENFKLRQLNLGQLTRRVHLMINFSETQTLTTEMKKAGNSVFKCVVKS